MKVIELIEAAEESGQKRPLKGGAYYSPSYDADSKHVLGSVQDWLDAMNVTKENVYEAMEKVRDLPIFKNEFPKAGLMYEKRPAGEKRGTFTFKVERFLPNGRSYDTFYNIYANGQIRWLGKSGYAGGIEYMSRLASPKPRIKAGDPVGSLVMIYAAAMEELLSKWKKSSSKMK